jgi:hypothetical protein
MQNTEPEPSCGFYLLLHASTTFGKLSQINIINEPFSLMNRTSRLWGSRSSNSLAAVQRRFSSRLAATEQKYRLQEKPTSTVAAVC